METTPAIRIYRALLRLYPGDFREEYGRELCLVLADRLRDEPSVMGRVLVWLHALVGIFIEAPIEHVRVLAEDVRYALRLVRRDTAMTVAAVTMLALGIGTATTIFSLANGLLLRPLPFPDASRLVALDEYSPSDSREHDTISLPNFADVRARTRLMTDAGVYSESAAILKGEPSAEQVPAASVTDGALRATGVSPELGQVFSARDCLPTGARVVVISDDLYRRRFGSDRAILGKTIESLNARYTIVGVMPPGFHFPGRADAWFPLRRDPATSPRTDYFLRSVARLKPGVTVAQADAEMRAMLTQIHAEHQPNNGWIGRARPLRDSLSQDYRSSVLTLLAGAGLLLAIACGNVANLLLVRASVRRREVSVRTALGATRRRLVRQLMTESLTLGLSGGVLGVLLARAGVPALLALVPIDLPRWMDFSIDGRVLVFAVILSVATSLAFGTLPALGISRDGVGAILKDAGRASSPGRGPRRVRNAVVVMELALSMTLLAGASLAARSFLEVRRQALGYNTSDVVSMEVARSQVTYATGAAQRALIDRIETELNALPGVVSAAFTTGVPLDDGWGRLFTIEGRPVPLESMPFINHIVVTPAYFTTLGIPLLQGRPFAAGDYNQHVLIVSRSFAARHFGHETALGKRVRFGPPKNQEPWYAIVGIVADTRHGILKGDDRDNVYLPYSDDVEPASLLVRASIDPRSLKETVARRIQEIDRNIALSQVRTLEEVVDLRAWQDRLLAVLFGGFAVLALLLAAAGFYAVLAYAVSLRTHEIGLRMALGASATGVRAMVLRHAMALAITGLAIGGLAAALLATLLRAQLYHVSPLDPASYVVAPIVFLFAGLAAAYIPSRRATRVDPVVALRHE